MPAESNPSERETVKPQAEVVEVEGEVVDPEGGAVEPADDALAPEEAIDGLPVLADVRPIEPASASALPAVQAAAVAATGFVAGAATVALVRRRTGRRLARAQGLDVRRPGPSFPGAGRGRTFLVHVRVLGPPEG